MNVGVPVLGICPRSGANSGALRTENISLRSVFSLTKSIQELFFYSRVTWVNKVRACSRNLP